MRITRVFTRRLVKHLSGGVEKLASMKKAVSFVDTGPMPQARRTQRAETVGAVVRSIVTITIWSIAVLTVLEILGINLGPLIAGGGHRRRRARLRRAVVGEGLPLRHVHAHGGPVRRRRRRRHRCPRPAGGGTTVTGTVEGVSLRTTRLRDIDGVVWHVPNGTIVRIGNKSQQWSRAVVDVPVTFQTDAGAATEVIRAVTDAGLARPRLRVDDPGRADRARRRVAGARDGW